MTGTFIEQGAHRGPWTDEDFSESGPLGHEPRSSLQEKRDTIKDLSKGQRKVMLASSRIHKPKLPLDDEP